MKISIWLKIQKLKLIDNLRYSLFIREATGWLLFVRGILSVDPAYRGARLARAIGFAESKRLLAFSVDALHANPGIEGAAEIWSKVSNSITRYKELREENPHLNRSIVLKAPSEHEKGVLLVHFEYNWIRLLLGLDDKQLSCLETQFDLIFSTSWSPTQYALLALILSKTSNTVFIQTNNLSDIAIIERLHPRLKCLPTMPCHWLNPNFYTPKSFSERTTDILMVANWGNFKRHWEFFLALTQMPETLNVVLIGEPENGRTIETLRKLATDIGVRQALQFIESIPVAEVGKHQCNAKVSIILSRREGCCVAAIESLFAGSALAMRADAHIGSAFYINEHTGVHLRPGYIAKDLQDLLEGCATLNTRDWALSHLSHQVSWENVNALMAETALKTGKPWTTDIILPQWRPHPTFTNLIDQENMRPVYKMLATLAPNTFSMDLLTESWR